MFDHLDAMFAGSFIKGSEFEKGLTLLMSKKPEMITASDPKYGFPEGHRFEGKTIQYTFELDGAPRTYDSKSRNFKEALEVAGVKLGEVVTITRKGEGLATTYEVVKGKAK